MNIHPILVHFPIALLTIYAIMECLRFKKLNETSYFFNIKAAFVIIGSLTALITFSSGDAAEHAVRTASNRALIEMHSNFAGISTAIFAVIAIVYLIEWLKETKWKDKVTHSLFKKVWNAADTYAAQILSNPWLPVVAFLGLVAITITGALGGAITYGPSIDPIVSFVYHLFF